MISDSEHMAKIRRRYLLAVVFIAVLIFALFVVNVAVYFVITTYFPQFSQYIGYAIEISRIILGIIGSYIVYRILVSIATIYAVRKHDSGTGEIAKILLRVLFYAIVISIVLSAAGISLTTALAGGAIGGIILGLAVQTVATNILSGILVSSSRMMLPGDVLLIHNSIGGDMVCCVRKVSTIITEVETRDGNKVKIPNTVLLSSTIFTQLRLSDGSYSYSFPVAMNADVPLKDFEKRVFASLKTKFAKFKEPVPQVFLIQKTAGVNSFNVLLKFDDFKQLNRLMNAVNTSFDEVYWSLKK